MKENGIIDINGFFFYWRCEKYQELLSRLAILKEKHIRNITSTILQQEKGWKNTKVIMETGQQLQNRNN